MLPVDHRLGGALRVFARRVLPPKLLRARRQQDELGKVAIEHRQVGNLFRIEVGGDIGAVGLQQRRSAGDFDLLADFTDLQVEVDGRLRVDADLDVGVTPPA